MTTSLTPLALLLMREMRRGLPTAVASVLGVLAWYAFLATRVDRRSWGLVLAMAQVPLWWMPLATLWRAYRAFKGDLDTPHAFLLLSLPVRGWQVAGAKLLAVWLECLVLAAAVFGGMAALLRGADLLGWLSLSPGAMAQFGQILVNALAVVLGLLLVFAVPAWLVLVQAAWSAGHTVGRGRRAVMVLAFLAGGWLLLRTAVAGAAVLSFLPAVHLVPVPALQSAGDGIWTVATVWLALEPGPFLAVVVATVLVFLAAARAVERALDAEAGRWRGAAAVVALAALAGVDLYLNGVGLVDRLLTAVLGLPV